MVGDEANMGVPTAVEKKDFARATSILRPRAWAALHVLGCPCSWGACLRAPMAAATNNRPQWRGFANRKGVVSAAAAPVRAIRAASVPLPRGSRARAEPRDLRPSHSGFPYIPLWGQSV